MLVSWSRARVASNSSLAPASPACAGGRRWLFSREKYSEVIMSLGSRTKKTIRDVSRIGIGYSGNRRKPPKQYPVGVNILPTFVGRRVALTLSAKSLSSTEKK